MGDVNPARERVDRRVLQALDFIEAEPAGEHDVGASHQRVFVQRQQGVGTTKGRQLVHAIIDDGCVPQMRRERQHLGRVIPEHRAIEPALCDQTVQQPAQCFDPAVIGARGRQMWPRDQHAFG